LNPNKQKNEKNHINTTKSITIADHSIYLLYTIGSCREQQQSRRRSESCCSSCHSCWRVCDNKMYYLQN